MHYKEHTSVPPPSQRIFPIDGAWLCPLISIRQYTKGSATEDCGVKNDSATTVLHATTKWEQHRSQKCWMKVGDSSGGSAQDEQRAPKREMGSTMRQPLRSNLCHKNLEKLRCLAVAVGRQRVARQNAQQKTPPQRQRRAKQSGEHSADVAKALPQDGECSKLAVASWHHQGWSATSTLQSYTDVAGGATDASPTAAMVHAAESFVALTRSDSAMPTALCDAQRR